MHELPLDTVWAWLVALVAEEPVSDNAREPLVAEDAVTNISAVQTEKNSNQQQLPDKCTPSR